MSQIQVGGGAGPDDHDDEVGAGGGQVQVSALDNLLEEIDVVLEANAQAFVQGFVQKGGQ